MSTFTREYIEQLRSTVPIEYIIGAYVPLKYGGPGRLVGRCPFHTERTGSFYVRIKEDSYHCFGCGQSGDMFHFIMELRGLKFVKAVRHIAKIATT